jgi:hypothetical protein
MSHDGAIYLAIILVAFFAFGGTLFWEMLTSGNRSDESRH